MRTLLTGFGPFGDVANNPTERLVAHFATAGAPGHKLTTHVLPVSFARASAELTELLAGGRFDAALLLGVASRAAEFRVERYAHNCDHAQLPDVDGAAPLESPICSGGPSRLETPLELEALVGALQSAGLPAAVSDSAGAYVCNRAYYAALHAIATRNLGTYCLFLHVPPDATTFAEPAGRPLVTFDQHVAAATITLHLMAAVNRPLG